MSDVLIASFAGLVLGYAPAKVTDRVWLASVSDDPRTETIEAQVRAEIGPYRTRGGSWSATLDLDH